MKRIFTLLLILSCVSIVRSQQWSIEYPTEKHEVVSFFHGDKSLQYDYAVGRYANENTEDEFPVALCINENGDYVDKIFYMDGKKAKFSSALGLCDGNVFVTAPYSEDTSSNIYEKLWVAVLNPDLEVVEESYINLDEPYLSFSSTAQSIINSDGEIVVVTLVADSIPEHTTILYDYSFYKFDAQCNMLKQSYLENDSRRSDIDDFNQVPGENIYALFGNGIHPSGMSNVIYIDDEFKYVSMSFLDEQQVYPDLLLPLRMSVDYWYDENHFLMSAQNNMTSGINDWRPFVVKMDTKMNIIKMLDFERVDTTDYVAEYKSMAYVDPNRIYVSTFWIRGSFIDTYPNSMTIYLINDNLDVLGRKTVSFDHYFYVLHIHSTSDGACILQGVLFDDEQKRSIIYKFKGEDFEIVTDIVDYNDDYEINCFPNPVSSSLNIDVSKITNSKAEIRIFDVMGRRYLDKDIMLDGNVLTLDVTPLPKGTYFYEIVIDNNNVIKEKFVKN